MRSGWCSNHWFLRRNRAGGRRNIRAGRSSMPWRTGYGPAAPGDCSHMTSRPARPFTTAGASGVLRDTGRRSSLPCEPGNVLVKGGIRRRVPGWWTVRASRRPSGADGTGTTAARTSRSPRGMSDRNRSAQRHPRLRSRAREAGAHGVDAGVPGRGPAEPKTVVCRERRSQRVEFVDQGVQPLRPLC